VLTQHKLDIEKANQEKEHSTEDTTTDNIFQHTNSDSAAY